MCVCKRKCVVDVMDATGQISAWSSFRSSSKTRRPRQTRTSRPPQWGRCARWETSNIATRHEGLLTLPCSLYCDYILPFLLSTVLRLLYCAYCTVLTVLYVVFGFTKSFFEIGTTQTTVLVTGRLVCDEESRMNSHSMVIEGGSIEYPELNGNGLVPSS